MKQMHRVKSYYTALKVLPWQKTNQGKDLSHSSSYPQHPAHFVQKESNEQKTVLSIYNALSCVLENPKI